MILNYYFNPNNICPSSCSDINDLYSPFNPNNNICPSCSSIMTCTPLLILIIIFVPHFVLVSITYNTALINPNNNNCPSCCSVNNLQCLLSAEHQRGSDASLQALRLAAGETAAQVPPHSHPSPARKTNLRYLGFLLQQLIYPNNSRDVYLYIYCPLTWDR